MAQRRWDGARCDGASDGIVRHRKNWAGGHGASHGITRTLSSYVKEPKVNLHSLGKGSSNHSNQRQLGCR